VSNPQYRLGLVLVVTATLAWSLSGLNAKFISADTTTILFWRGVFGAGGLLLFMLFVPSMGGLKTFRNLGWSGCGYGLITSISMLLYISAIKNTSVAHVSVITAIVPFFAAFLGWLLLNEKPSRSVIIASVAALFGVMMMAGLSNDGHWLGDTYAVFMALGMAGMILISRRYKNIPALAATCLASILTAIATLPFASLVSVTNFDLGMLLIFGLVNQVAGFGLFALGAKYLPPMETALITALDAPLAPLWVWLVLSEQPGAPTLIGGTIVLTAVLTHIWWSNRA
jgi:drug/metabolite transporter (DMT)-like permease